MQITGERVLIGGYAWLKVVEYAPSGSDARVKLDFHDGSYETNLKIDESLQISETMSVKYLGGYRFGYTGTDNLKPQNAIWNRRRF